MEETEKATTNSGRHQSDKNTGGQDEHPRKDMLSRAGKYHEYTPLPYPYPSCSEKSVKLRGFPSRKFSKWGPTRTSPCIAKSQRLWAQNKGLIWPPRCCRTTDKGRQIDQVCGFPKKSTKKKSVRSGGWRKMESEELEDLGMGRKSRQRQRTDYQDSKCHHRWLCRWRNDKVIPEKTFAKSPERIFREDKKPSPILPSTPEIVFSCSDLEWVIPGHYDLMVISAIMVNVEVKKDVRWSREFGRHSISGCIW